MKVALDEGVPEDLIRHLTGHDVHLIGHDVRSVRMLGLKGVKNGKLLAAVAEAEFHAFITNDKRMEAEGQLRLRSFATLILSATNWNVIKPHIGNIAAALETARAGEVTLVECGRFVHRPKGKPSTEGS